MTNDKLWIWLQIMIQKLLQQNIEQHTLLDNSIPWYRDSEEVIWSKAHKDHL